MPGHVRTAEYEKTVANACLTRFTRRRFAFYLGHPSRCLSGRLGIGGRRFASRRDARLECFKNIHADVIRQRSCRYVAKESGRPYEELLQESVMEEKAFWKTYDGDRSIAGILRSRYP
jgi:hypothetical protein